MSAKNAKYLKFGSAIAVIVISLGYLGFTGVEESKSYYVTIKELEGMAGEAHGKRLRVAGNVQPGSIRQSGTSAEFVLVEEGRTLKVSYKGSEPPPDTFKDDAQALAEGEFGRDGVFHAKKLQAKCASKYAPKEGEGAEPGVKPASDAPRKTAAAQPATGN